MCLVSQSKRICTFLSGLAKVSPSRLGEQVGYQTLQVRKQNRTSLLVHHLRLRSQGRTLGSTLDWGTKSLHAARCGKNPTEKQTLQVR